MLLTAYLDDSKIPILIHGQIVKRTILQFEYNVFVKSFVKDALEKTTPFFFNIFQPLLQNFAE